MKNPSDTLITSRYLEWRRVKPLIPEYYIKKSSTHTRVWWDAKLMREGTLLSVVNLMSVIRRLAQDRNINFWKYDNRVKSEDFDFPFDATTQSRFAVARFAIFRRKTDAKEKNSNAIRIDRTAIELAYKHAIHWKVLKIVRKITTTFYPWL